MSDTTYKVASWFADDFEDLQTDPVFVAEDVILDVTEQIHVVMQEKDVTQTELAKRIGEMRDSKPLNRSAISQLLSGNQNISIKRLVEVALALGMTITAPQLVEMEAAHIESVDTGAWVTERVEAEGKSQSQRESLWNAVRGWEAIAQEGAAKGATSSAANDYSTVSEDRSLELAWSVEMAA